MIQIATSKIRIRPSEISTRMNAWAEDLLTIRGAIGLLSWVGVGLAVVAALSIGRDVRRAEQFPIPQIVLSSEGEQNELRTNKPLQQYQVIKSRDLFNVKTTSTATPSQSSNATQLKMRLVGTSVSSSGPIAILEDLNKTEQDVFGIGETIFARARLVSVANESVRVDFNGKEETLFIEEGVQREGASPTTGSDESGEFSVAESDLNDALSNLPLLLSQARAVPYFRNGQSIGMRLFAIRRDSMYEKLGLKNGDILLSVNEHNLSDPSQALKIFEQLRTERSIGVKLERNGQPQQMSYTIR